jgi:hypothetical protein
MGETLPGMKARKLLDPLAGKTVAFMAELLPAEVHAAVVNIAVVVPPVLPAAPACLLILEPGAGQAVDAAGGSVTDLIITVHFLQYYLFGYFALTPRIHRPPRLKYSKETDKS